MFTYNIWITHITEESPLSENLSNELEKMQVEDKIIQIIVHKIIQKYRGKNYEFYKEYAKNNHQILILILRIYIAILLYYISWKIANKNLFYLFILYEEYFFLWETKLI